MENRKRVITGLIAFGILFQTCLRGTDPSSASAVPSGTLIWQLGEPDNLYNEFGTFHKGPEVVTMPDDAPIIDACKCSKI